MYDAVSKVATDSVDTKALLGCSVLVGDKKAPLREHLTGDATIVLVRGWDLGPAPVLLGADFSSVRISRLQFVRNGA